MLANLACRLCRLGARRPGPSTAMRTSRRLLSSSAAVRAENVAGHGWLSPVETDTQPPTETLSSRSELEQPPQDDPSRLVTAEALRAAASLLETAIREEDHAYAVAVLHTIDKESMEWAKSLLDVQRGTIPGPDGSQQPPQPYPSGSPISLSLLGDAMRFFILKTDTTSLCALLKHVDRHFDAGSEQFGLMFSALLEHMFTVFNPLETPHVYLVLRKFLGRVGDGLGVTALRSLEDPRAFEQRKLWDSLRVRSAETPEASKLADDMLRQRPLIPVRILRDLNDLEQEACALAVQRIEADVRLADSNRDFRNTSVVALRLLGALARREEAAALFSALKNDAIALVEKNDLTRWIALWSQIVAAYLYCQSRFRFAPGVVGVFRDYVRLKFPLRLLNPKLESRKAQDEPAKRQLSQLLDAFNFRRIYKNDSGALELPYVAFSEADPVHPGLQVRLSSLLRDTFTSSVAKVCSWQQSQIALGMYVLHHEDLKPRVAGALCSQRALNADVDATWDLAMFCSREMSRYLVKPTSFAHLEPIDAMFFSDIGYWQGALSDAYVKARESDELASFQHWLYEGSQVRVRSHSYSDLMQIFAEERDVDGIVTGTRWYAEILKQQGFSSPRKILTWRLATALASMGEESIAMDFWSGAVAEREVAAFHVESMIRALQTGFPKNPSKALSFAESVMRRMEPGSGGSYAEIGEVSAKRAAGDQEGTTSADPGQTLLSVKGWESLMRVFGSGKDAAGVREMRYRASRAGFPYESRDISLAYMSALANAGDIPAAEDLYCRVFANRFDVDAAVAVAQWRGAAGDYLGAEQVLAEVVCGSEYLCGIGLNGVLALIFAYGKASQLDRIMTLVSEIEAASDRPENMNRKGIPALPDTRHKWEDRFYRGSFFLSILGPPRFRRAPPKSLFAMPTQLPHVPRWTAGNLKRENAFDVIRSSCLPNIVPLIYGEAARALWTNGKFAEADACLRRPVEMDMRGIPPPIWDEYLAALRERGEGYQSLVALEYISACERRPLRDSAVYQTLQMLIKDLQDPRAALKLIRLLSASAVPRPLLKYRSGPALMDLLGKNKQLEMALMAGVDGSPVALSIIETALQNTLRGVSLRDLEFLRR